MDKGYINLWLGKVHAAARYYSIYGPIDHSVIGLFVHYSGHHSVNGLFGYRTTFGHLGTGHV